MRILCPHDLAGAITERNKLLTIGRLLGSAWAIAKNVDASLPNLEDARAEVEVAIHEADQDIARYECGG